MTCIILCFTFQVTFLRYSQQWKKKVVFVLNKADIYQDIHEVYTDIISSSSSVVK